MLSGAKKKKKSCLSYLPDTVINPALSQRPRKISTFLRTLESEKCGKLVPFQSAEVSLLTATLRLFFWLVVSCPRCDRQPE